MVLLDLNEVIHTVYQWKPYFKPLFSTEKYKQYTATTQESSFLFKNVANTLNEADVFPFSEHFVKIINSFGVLFKRL